MNPQIAELANLGPKSQSWLNEIGVHTRADIERIGSLEIYRLLREHGIPASLNLVYAIEASEHWTRLSPSLKAELRGAVRRISK